MAWTPGRTLCTRERTAHTGTSSGQRCTQDLPWDGMAAEDTTEKVERLEEGKEYGAVRE